MLAFTAVNTAVNLVLIRRVPPVAISPADAPFVSILVPARNEEKRIVDCLASLAAQDYPRFEIILLDDNSEDRTRPLASAIGFGNSKRLRLIAGQPLPHGWVGKCWACAQLAETARGEYLLFTDADTVHEPWMLASAMQFARAEQTSLLSVWPKQITGTLGEKLVIPLIYLAGVGFLPHAVTLAAQKWPRLARMLGPKVLRAFGAANGQFLLWRRADYEAVGGHAALRNHLVEDVGLGRLVASRIGEGQRLINADGDALVRCRMYETFPEVWEGFTKNCWAAFDGSMPLFLMIGVLNVVTFFLPFAFAFLPGATGRVALVEVIVIYLLRFVLTVRYRSSLLGALLHPVAVLVSAGIAVNSWRKSIGRGVQWKGRTYRP